VPKDSPFLSLKEKKEKVLFACMKKAESGMETYLLYRENVLLPQHLSLLSVDDFTLIEQVAKNADSLKRLAV
jgi:hypothetical protein